MSLHALFKHSVRFNSTSSLISKVLSRHNDKTSRPICIPSSQFPGEVQGFGATSRGKADNVPTRSPRNQPRSSSKSWIGKYRNKYQNAEQFIARNLENRGLPWHKLPNTLPRAPTDIKGIDATLHNSMGNKFRKLPHLAESSQLSIRFIPSLHKLADARKSNVAYAYNYSRGFRLNSPDLEKDMNKYNGALKQRMIFQTKSLPFGGSVTRSRTRKLTRDSLFKAIQQEFDDENASVVSGVFLFSFIRPPASARDRKTYEKIIKDAVKKLATDKAFWAKLRAAVMKQNASLTQNNALGGVRRELLINAENTLGYSPRLPFL